MGGEVRALRAPSHRQWIKPELSNAMDADISCMDGEENNVWSNRD